MSRRIGVRNDLRRQFQCFFLSGSGFQHRFGILQVVCYDLIHDAFPVNLFFP